MLVKTDSTRKTDAGLLTAIKNILLSRKTEPSAINIANACFETINRLNSRGKSEFCDLLEVVASAGIFTVTETSLKALSASLDEHSLVWCRILKNFFLRDCINSVTNSSITTQLEIPENSDLFTILVDKINLVGIKSLISKNFRMTGLLDGCSIETVMRVLENCMDTCIENVDVVGFIESLNEQSNKIILEYFRVKTKRLERIQCTEISRISKLVTPLQPECLETLILLLTFYKNNKLIARVTGNGPVESIFTRNFVETVRSEVLDGKHTDSELVPLFSLLSEDLLPAFSSLVVEINNGFLSEGKFQKILQNIISYISIMEFSEIVGSICISKHCLVLKGLSNVDLSVFFAMYRFYSGSSMSMTAVNCYSMNAGLQADNAGLSGICSENINCVPEDGLSHLLSCLPSFCYYCTDHFNNSPYLIKILEYHVNTHPSVVASAVEKLIYSHTNNLNSLLSLKSPIPREQSLNILSLLSESSILNALLEKFIESDTFDCEDGLRLLFKLCNIDLSSQITPVILGTGVCQSAVLNGISLSSALRLMIFFVPNYSFNMDYISRLVELCGGKDTAIQKRGYRLLYEIYSLRRTQVCICDILSTSLSRTANISGDKYRLLLLNRIIRNGCNCETDKREMVDKFVTETVRGLAVGNVKCRKIAKEIIQEMGENEVEHLFGYVFGKRNDTEVMCGCVEAARVFIEQHVNTNEVYSMDKTYATNEITISNTNNAFEALLSLSSHSLQVAKHVIWAFNSFMENNIGFYEEMAEVIDQYILQFSKKMNKELKEFCINAKKRRKILTKNMKTLLKFRNKGGKEQKVEIIEKVEFNELL